jgi:vanillate O-demethylase ferredoxin subunit
MQRDDAWIPATLRATRALTPGIREFTLVPDEGAAPYAAGAHLRIRLDVAGRTTTRHYSLIGAAPREGAWRIAVQREDAGRGGSRAMWSLEPGARLSISRPASHFELAAGAPEVLLLAGGIGITPLLGMAEVLRRRGARFRLLYAGRSRAAMAYLPELASMLGDSLVVQAEDEVGRPDLAAAFGALAPGAEAYVCGPIGLLGAARRAWPPPGGRRRASFSKPSAPPATRRSASSWSGSRASGARSRYRRMSACSTRSRRLASACCRTVVAGSAGSAPSTCWRSRAAGSSRRLLLGRQHAENRQVCACVSRMAGGAIAIDPPWRGDTPLAPGHEGQRPSTMLR